MGPKLSPNQHMNFQFQQTTKDSLISPRHCFSVVLWGIVVLVVVVGVCVCSVIVVLTVVVVVDVEVVVK